MQILASINRPLALKAYTLPPHSNEHGSHDPSVVVEFLETRAANQPSMNLTLSLDEASQLIAELSRLVEAAKAGQYSDLGHQIVDRSKSDS